MNEYVIVVPSIDFNGDVHANMFFISGIEAAWELYDSLADIFDDVALADAETGEIIDIYNAFARAYGYDSSESELDGYDEVADDDCDDDMDDFYDEAPIDYGDDIDDFYDDYLEDDYDWNPYED